MIDKLIKLANHLDSKGLTKEADYLDSIIKISSEQYKVDGDTHDFFNLDDRFDFKKLKGHKIGSAIYDQLLSAANDMLNVAGSDPNETAEDIIRNSAKVNPQTGFILYFGCAETDSGTLMPNDVQLKLYGNLVSSSGKDSGPGKQSLEINHPVSSIDELISFGNFIYSMKDDEGIDPAQDPMY